MKSILFTFTFLFSFHLNAKEYYLLIDHGPESKVVAQDHFDLFKDYGRSKIFTLRKNSFFKKKFLPFFRTVSLLEVKSYFPKFSKLEAANPEIMKMISQITEEQIHHIVSKISSFEKRSAGTKDNRSASYWIEQEFKRLNLNTINSEFRSGISNIIAFKKASIKTKETILVTAHLDSVGKSFAGADDNASGIAGLLLLAKSLSSLSSRRHIVFLATNAEENGLWGSKAYVRKMIRNQTIQNIKFVINMDMIAYNHNGIIDLETNRPFEQTALHMAKLAKIYTSLTPKIVMPAWGSDHVPFLKQKIPTVLTIEHWESKTPCYHSRCDLPEHLTYGYAKEVIALNLASLIEKSQVEFKD